MPIRKGVMMSQHDLPEAKPDLMVKAWGILVAGKAPAVLFLVAMALAAWVVVRLFGH
jgi:hypothetical protein